MMQLQTKKELGQNFLFDQSTLNQIADYGELTSDDTVLEIGPGLGPLTTKLVQQAGQVTAVEFDTDLAGYLQANVIKQLADDGVTISGDEVSNLAVMNEDILCFNLETLPKDYKVIANIPYNITSKIIEKLWTADNKPVLVVLLVQKEVAERLAATAGQLSVLAISAQIFAEVELGIKVPAELFNPAPKVDSQVVIMRRRSQPLVEESVLEQFFYVVKAGFSEKRKKLRSSLAVGLRTNKTEAERLLTEANIDYNKRAQELTIEEWKRLAKI